jgi:hypothetical protein
VTKGMNGIQQSGKEQARRQSALIVTEKIEANRESALLTSTDYF